MQDITKLAEQLNAKVSQLNNERSRQLGMQEAAKKQYENAVKGYEAKYGVKLTEQNLQEEYNKVYAEVKGKVSILQESIASIERGDYKNIDKPSDIDLEPDIEPTIQEVKKVEPVTQPQVEEPAPIIKPEPIVQPINVEGFVTDKKQDMAVNFGVPYGAEAIQSKVEEKSVIDSEVKENDDKPFWETSVSVPPVPPVAPVEKQVAPSTINFGGTAQPAPVFGGPQMNFEVEDSFDGVLDEDDSDFYDDIDELPTPPTKSQPVAPTPPTKSQPVAPKVEVSEVSEIAEDDDDEVISPEGWGLPKDNIDINKNFEDILGQSGIKFGE